MAKQESKPRRMKPDTPRWHRLAYELLRGVAHVKPCHDCGAPVLDGYCCGRCGSAGPMSTETELMGSKSGRLGVARESAKLAVTERLAAMGHHVPDDVDLDQRLDRLYGLGYQAALEEWAEARVALRHAIEALVSADPGISTGVDARHVNLRERLKSWRVLAGVESEGEP